MKGQAVSWRVPLGYRPLWAPPPDAVGLDWERLLLQVAIVGLGVGALFWLAHARPGSASHAATHPRPSNPSRAAEPGSVPPDVSPSMATFFDQDRDLLPELVPYRKEGLLAVDPETLIPTWYPDSEGSPRQRVAEFETTLRAVRTAGPRALEPDQSAGDDSEVTRLLAALRVLRSVMRT